MNPAKLAVTRLLMYAFAGGNLFTLTAAAQVRVRVPSEDHPGIPAYTRTDDPRSPSGGQFLYRTEEWAAIVFYRRPDCVPKDFNLLTFPDLTLAGDPPTLRPFLCPMTVSGFELWENGPPLDIAPRHTQLSGLAAPVWFVLWPSLQAAIADGLLTISKLEALNPLRGTATAFHEVLHPAGGAKAPVLTITASGNLPDGRSFQYHFTWAWNQPRPTVRINFR